MSQPPQDPPVVAIVGGTGQLGRGLAKRLAAGGVQVVLGSRDAARAAEATTGLGGHVTGASNEHCVADAAIVIVAVPWDVHAEVLTALAGVLAGKVVVDCVNPLAFDRQGPYVPLVPEGSAAMQARTLLPDSTVVGAFHHLSAVTLLDDEVKRVDADVLVLGDDRAATDLVQALASRIAGCRGIYAGRLRNAGQVEALTANLIAINRRYAAHAGLRVTDV